MGGIPLLLDLMGPANRDQVRIKATSAVWNFAGSEELQRLLLGEGTQCRATKRKGEVKCLHNFTRCAWPHHPVTTLSHS